MVNALTIDVEDWFQVSAMARYVPRSRWEDTPCRVARNVDRILALLDAHGARATFFTLGWIADRHPAVVKHIAAHGHEIGSHGYAHHRVTELDPPRFVADIRRAKAVLEDLTGTPVRGYRAPSFSINGTNAWAFDGLVAAGYRYSSSVYPIRHDHYGMPDAPRFPYASRDGLLEVPITTTRLFARNWPAGGGGYFRLMPYGLSRWCIERVNRTEGRPAVFYFHPWEIDPAQPRVRGVDARTRFRHYVNLHRMERRVGRLLGDFSWDRADAVFLDGARR
jgi:polysaccharide deacetylase family protein (PEP-CTERM system associated)